jgi:anaerobic magnesium-protoporphyrin IX monomethyl ester cyclase
MKVALIYPDFPEWNVGGCYYTGVASLSACLEHAGHEVLFMHITSPVDKEEFLRPLRAHRPRLIGFSSTTPMFRHVQQWAQWARELEDVTVICGGVQARMDPEGTLGVPAIDAVCYGEGELSLLALCEKLEKKQDLTTTDDFLFKKGSQIIRNPLKILQDLNQLPDPDRDIFDHGKLYDYCKEGFASTATFVFSRGCPFDCSYCCNTRMMRYAPDGMRSVRYFSPERSVDQIVNHLKKYPHTEYVRIDDTNVSINRHWVTQFCRLYQQRVQKPFMCQVRIHPSLFDEEIVVMLKESGCFLLILGVEHGNEEYRKRVLNRAMSDEDIISAFRLCRKHELATRAFVMFGTPYETVDLMIETVKLLAKSEVFDLSASIFYPFPGTASHEVCQREGFKMSGPFTSGWPMTVLEQRQITKDAVVLVWRGARILLLAYALLYKGLLAEQDLGTEAALDTLVQSTVKKIDGKLTKTFIDELGKYDSLAHGVYKRVFHPEIVAQGDLLLRV